MARIMATSAGLVPLIGALAAAMPRAAQDKPNIIMFFVDDLGYGDLGFNGHPTVVTPNIDKLAYNGKILSSWYSGCPVCSGSRAALMTGRQFNRLGVPGVFGPVVTAGLPLNETTAADQMKKAGYATAAMGKWHLGQREMYLPTSRGFDYYLGIPYSDDMGAARATPCAGYGNSDESMRTIALPDNTDMYSAAGTVNEDITVSNDPGGSLLPLVYQDASNKTTMVLEQPLDFTHLAEKYEAYVTGFIEAHATVPFFLYMPFSHVHTTAGNQPHEQYAGCKFKNTTRRGPFGDALAEVDWIIGEVVSTVEANNIDKNTLMLFTGDNGPWLIKGLSGGSRGILDSRYAGYWNTGKGSTWEGGMHEAAFAYWPGTIAPQSRSSEVTSSLDLVPTISALAGVDLPKDRVYDGRDMSHILLDQTGTAKSLHDFLFFYGSCGKDTPSAVRHGRWKAYWCTAEGLGGSKNSTMIYPPEQPLVFDLWEDPSESTPVIGNDTAPVPEIVQAYLHEIATFTRESLVSPPGQPSEEYQGKYYYSICCSRSEGCDCNGKPSGRVDTSALPWFVNPAVFTK